MDRTTLTANLKPLERRGLMSIMVDPKDKRGRLLKLTKSGQELLILAVPIWRATHDEVDKMLQDPEGRLLRADLYALSFPDKEQAPYPMK
jgi:DNA-binding MarR family transcriptional regulator